MRHVSRVKKKINSMPLRSPRGSTGFLRGDTFSKSALTNISEKKLSQLFYMKMKICFDPCFIDIRVAMATK